ncbi:MAG: alpha/beta hydrolase [Bacteroidetes bacterium]|nr:alpha/beta hydrolase [Bacteroidota bacterium]
MPAAFRLLIFALILGVSACQSHDPENLEEVIYLRKDGADMPAYIYGNATSKTFILVLHGGPGGSGLGYRLGTYSDLLEEQFAVVYWDQRGQGMSQGQYNSSDLMIQTITEDLAELCLLIHQEYGPDIRLFLMGHSWGGTLGTAFLVQEENQLLVDGWIDIAGAHDFPELFRTQVPLVDSIADEQISLGNDAVFWNQVKTGIGEFQEDLSAGNDLIFLNQKANEAETYLRNRGYTDPISDKDQNKVFTSNYFANNPLVVSTNGLHTSLVLNDELIKTSLTDQLASIKVPSLILWGAYDLVVPSKLGEDAFELIGTEDKEYIIFSASGHSPMLNEPVLFSGAIIDWIGEH